MNDNSLDGKELGGALEHLRQVARVWLPRMADYYIDAANAMNEAGKYDSDMFRRDPYFSESGSEGPMAGRWRNLRERYEACLGNSANTYFYTGVALDWGIDALVAQDEAAGAELDRLRSDIEDTAPSGGNEDFGDDEYAVEFTPYTPD